MVPVKFSLGGNQTLNIFLTGNPRSHEISCDNAAPVDAVESTSNAGTNSLRYDAATGQYIYNWKTEKGWAGACRRIFLGLRDGSERFADFKLLK